MLIKDVLFHSPVSRSSSASKSSKRAYSMITLPRPLWSSIVTFNPSARCSCSCASRTLGSMGGSALGSFFALAAGVDQPLHVVLGLAHRHGKRRNALRRLFHLLGMFKGQQRARVAKGQFAGLDTGLHSTTVTSTNAGS